MEIGLSLGLTGQGQAPDAWVLRDDQGDAFLWDADFVAGRYYYNGTLYPTLSGWLTAIGATFGRASAAGYRDSTGAWAVASSGTLRQHRTAAAKGLGLVLEANRAQFLTSPTAPATQTQSLAAATYVCWLEGAGSVELSGGPTGTVTEGNPVTFTLGGTTAVTFTVSGDVTRFQCERDYPSTFMATSRTAADSLVIGPNGSSKPFTGWSDTEGTLVAWARTAQGFRTSDQMLVQIDDTSNNERLAIYRSSAGANLSAIVVDGGVTQMNPSLVGIQSDEDQGIALAWRANDMAASFNGAAETGATSATVPSPTRLVIGNKIGGDQWFGTVARLAYAPRRIPDLSERATLFPVRTRAIHGLGDSFASSGWRSALDSLLTVPLSMDGVGGSTLVEQAARWALTPAFWRDTLIMTDDMSGMDISTILATYAEIIGRLNHSRFLIIEPGIGVGETTGSAGRIARDAKWNAIVAAYPNNTVPVLAYMQSLSDGGVDDTQYVADGLWPLSCLTSAADYHPNTKGNTGYAQVTYDALVAQGWA
ncbi:hypothetical protein [Phenylobacterium sp. J367]|uniref:hypothetical protein n=1 Tax=Phenylobacterium sp. J367 TaxID=2898435 RepID=UPI002150FA1A|nr:hypothetical protein [Phenylobacterium sp. J367]MCR5876998.1 hypothetical protein [Phenylobacterium sp. J367]